MLACWLLLYTVCPIFQRREKVADRAYEVWRICIYYMGSLHVCVYIYIKVVVSVEDQATALLLKASRLLHEDGTVTDQAKEVFSGQFVQPLIPDVVGDMRLAFGLPPAGGKDCLSALVADGEV
jgi:hypothetical protein